MKDIFERTKAHAEILQFLHLGFKVNVEFGGDYYVTTNSGLTWVNEECLLRLENKNNGHFEWKVLVHRRDGRGFGYSDSFINQAIKPYIRNLAISNNKGRKNLNSHKDPFLNDQLCSDSHAVIDDNFYWLGDMLYMDVYNVGNVPANPISFPVGRFKVYTLIGLYPISTQLSLTNFIHASALPNRKGKSFIIPVKKKKGYYDLI